MADQEHESGNHRKARKDFLEQVRKIEERKQRARRKKERSLWFGLGVIGVIGWSVVIPTLLGLLLGIWLDRNFSSQIPWTLVLLLGGLIIGCINAWYWVMEEQKSIERDRQKGKRE